MVFVEIKEMEQQKKRKIMESAMAYGMQKSRKKYVNTINCRNISVPLFSFIVRYTALLVLYWPKVTHTKFYAVPTVSPPSLDTVLGESGNT